MTRKSELDHLREIETPRPDEVCNALAWRVEPLAGFILWGVLWNVWLTTMAFTAGLLLGVGLGDALTGNKNVSGLLAAVFGTVTAGISVWFFVRWVRRKRGSAKALIRDGVIVEGKVAAKATDELAQAAARVAFVATGQRLAASWYRVTFVQGIGSYHVLCPLPSPPKDGAKVPVLFLPDHKYALGFAPDGRAIPVRLHRD
jgi:hypothetical protein